MNICEQKEIKKIVQTRAKYQKVMLLYDNTATNSQIFDIHESVKDACIFNKLDVINSDLEEVYNGYKLIIYLCSSSTYLQLAVRNSEFVNIFVPTDEGVLPYFLNEDNVNMDSSNYIVLNNSSLDLGIVTSELLARFYNYFKDLIYNQTSEIEFNFNLNEITKKNLLSLLNSLPKMEFVDIAILKFCKLEYRFLPLLDYLIISAFQVLISNLKTNCYTLVDTYKVAKDDCLLIDKFYSMANNNLIIDLVNFNFNRLNVACQKTREKILEVLPANLVEKELIDELILNLKNYCKNDEGLLGYLYLYNIFNF